MDGYTISQVAERTGFSPSALRFYEQSGLVRPDRTASGYRSYDDADVEHLRFIGRAKGFGLTLDEITELLAMLEDERCAPVQGRLQELVADKIADVQRRVADLLAFTGELQRVAVALDGHTPDGPCDDRCGCTTAPLGPEPTESVGVALVARPAADAPSRVRSVPSHDPPIACTLAPGEARTRVEDWQLVLATKVGCDTVDGGVRVRFAPGTDPVPIAALAAAEQSCCSFMGFNLRIDPLGVALEVTGSPEARPVIEALMGVGGVNRGRAARSGAVAAAACVACCAPPIIATLGVTAGLATVAGVLVGVAAAVFVALLGGAWLATRIRRAGSARRDASCASTNEPVAVAAPTRRGSGLRAER